MNLPNKLTLARLLLTAVFVLVFDLPVANHASLALLIFVTAIITDYLDGEIARRQKLETDFGRLMDPLADKIMTCSAFVAFVESTHMKPDAQVKVGAWMVVIIVARELAITGLRLLAASKNIVLAAERYGKHKTISQIVTLIALLVVDASKEWPPGLQKLFASWTPMFADIMLWITVVLTAASGLIYLWRNRQLYLDDV